MTKARYAFNGRFLTKGLTGQERYALELLTHMDKICEKGEFCVVTSLNALYLPDFKNIEIMYKHEVKFGETIDLFYAEKNNTAFVTMKNHLDKTLHCIIKLY